MTYHEILTKGRVRSASLLCFAVAIALAPASLAFAAALLVPADAPKGGIGFMGIREVINNGGISDQDQARASLNNGGGDIMDYTASVLNIQDSGGAGHFGGDSNFGVVDNPTGGPRFPSVARGAVDNISLLAQGTIRIDTAGDYTFGVNSDDGFTLLFPGFDFVDNGATTVFDQGRALQFFGGRGAADTLGTVNLPAGNIPFIVNFHEGGGGSAVELFAAQGAKSSFDGDFRLVGHQAGPDVLVPGVVGDIFASVVKRNDGGELTTLAGAIDLLNNPGTNDVFVGTVPHLSVGDPETNPHDFSFPGLDNGVDDNDFASKFSGFIEVPADGDYTFLFQTDDNSQLTIGGADFTINSSGNPGATTVENGGQTVSADFLTGNTDTNVTTFLTEGFHPFEFIQLERGGGADAELFVVAGGVASPLGLLDAGSVSDVDGLQLVPEPSSMALAMLGLAGLLGYAWRRRQS